MKNILYVLAALLLLVFVSCKATSESPAASTPEPTLTTATLTFTMTVVPFYTPTVTPTSTSTPVILIYAYILREGVLPNYFYTDITVDSAAYVYATVTVRNVTKDITYPLIKSGSLAERYDLNTAGGALYYAGDTYEFSILIDGVTRTETGAAPGTITINPYSTGVGVSSVWTYNGNFDNIIMSLTSFPYTDTYSNYEVSGTPMPGAFTIADTNIPTGAYTVTLYAKYNKSYAFTGTASGSTFQIYEAASLNITKP